MEVYHSENEHIESVSKVISKNKEVFYKVELQNHHKKHEILLDNEGNIVKSF